MLQVEKLEVRYGRLAAVRGVSLTVGEGELVSVVGPNGAGKSTTLLAIAGALRGSSGSITFDGKRIDGSSPEAVAALGVSLVPEGRGVFTQLTVKENLLLGTPLRSGRGSVQADLERELARFPVLERCLSANAGKLSGGEQQQLVIARALMSRPRLLLLDEPSLGLAPLLVNRVFEIVAELRASGVTVLLVEQLAHRAVALADRSYVFSHGEVAATGSAEELAAAVDLESSYLGQKAVNDR
ncbi:ABC transporter ATP-binding protein [Conexibacter woesei]|uniref:ABC transporter related protein n=1 Tax=Conexibacter woesei (strain DSM 14684 / CCUG 47730 / CIP 108061 / JCM 11494 / NBRC 100937 / ID131577) TaxID=469383 RepID=D3F6Z5_CONWI|nr:ABC transporter ATP-binding protein [Conexibacter woesei]ADB52793.1 ABC transporter related protein [Conexibacter woesei DSM 14684]